MKQCAPLASFLLLSHLSIAADSWRVDAGSWVRRSRSHATARRAALDAVAAIRTLEAEEDGAQRSHASETSGPALLSARTARARRAGLPRQSPARGAPDAAPQAPP